MTRTTFHSRTRAIVVALALSAGGLALVAPTATACAHGQHTFQLTAATFEVLESAGSAEISVTYTGDNTCAPGSVDWSATGGTAMAGTHFSPSSGTLAFPAGGGTLAIVLTIVDDDADNADRTVVLALSNPRDTAGQQPATLGTPSTATLTILDDDEPPTGGDGEDGDEGDGTGDGGGEDDGSGDDGTSGNDGTDGDGGTDDGANGDGDEGAGGDGGLAPLAEFSPSTLAFGEQVVGGTSSPMTLRVVNRGTAALVVRFALAESEFPVSNGCGAPVAPQQSCPIHVSFRPAQSGERSGALVVTHNATGSPT
ncbi:MAG TPA: choice-of-anchor D domain-containing protein, partial [Candidatus Thermoplasmatota archaeon]|nr:choice-of-anchor D domain-containing protein [Candidatus Thermoplasmatota archaeon]